MKVFQFILAIFLLSEAMLNPAAAIVKSNDRNQDSYRKQAKEFPEVGIILPRRGLGTLIADRWVITSAQVAQSIPEGQGAMDFQGKRYEIEKIVINRDGNETEANRIALLKLRKPVKKIDPISIYSGASEVGLIAVLLGYGSSEPTDISTCAATNKVEEVSPDWIFFRFDESPDATDLKGICAAGDLGGPAIIEIKGKRFLVGINVANPESGNSTIEKSAYIVYTRLSSCYDWIVDTMRSAILTE